MVDHLDLQLVQQAFTVDTFAGYTDTVHAAEAVAGLAVEKEGATHLFSEAEVEQLKQQLSGLKDNDNFARLARWFFADRATRTISSFQSETVAEYVQRRIAEDTLSGLEEAVRLDPTNSLALARLAKAVLKADHSQNSRTVAEAAHLARQSLRFDPNQTDALEVLRCLGASQAGSTYYHGSRTR
jgi:hypothetical protein